jgi:hypothetical protein
MVVDAHVASYFLASNTLDVEIAVEAFLQSSEKQNGF